MADGIDSEIQLMQLEQQADIDALVQTVSIMSGCLDSILTKICQLKDDLQALLDRTTPKSNCVFYAVRTWTPIIPLCEVQYLPWRTQLSSAVSAQATAKAAQDQASPATIFTESHSTYYRLATHRLIVYTCIQLLRFTYRRFPSLRTRRLPLLRDFVSTAVFYRRAVSSQLHQGHFVVATSSTSSTAVCRLWALLSMVKY